MNTIKQQKPTVSLFEVTTEQLNQRLDNFLLKQLDSVPRTRIYRIIRKGEVRVNKKRCKPEYKLQLGDLVRIPPVYISDEPSKKRIPTRLVKLLTDAILFQDEHIIVINKPSGIAVHAGSGVDYGVIDILRENPSETRLELVHRLDRDTSGCLLLARNRQALLAMQNSLKQSKIGKTYVAVVNGNWPAELVEIADPLKKYTLSNGERRVRVDNQGKSALSLFKPLQSGGQYSLIEVKIITGRTHQIRVHCQSAGHPIAGDEKYGDAEFNRFMRQSKIKRLMLHAASLELPTTDYTQERIINAPLPAEFERLFKN